MARSSAPPGEQVALPALVERDAELRRLRAAVTAAAGGRGSAVAVVGPAGIGKTGLLAAAREMAGAAGLAVLSARGGELEAGFPFGIVHQLFDLPIARLAPAARDRILEGAAGLAAPLVGAGSAGEPPEPGFPIIHALYWLAANLAEQQPVAVVVDDLHWADEASLRVLAYLAARVEEHPMALVTATRPAAGHRHAELIDAVTDVERTARLAPACLTRAGVARLLEQRFPGAVDTGTVDALHHATGGNPLLCHAVATAGPQPIDGAAVRAAAGGVAPLVMRRIGRLPSAAIRLARAVAVLGNVPELRHAAALSGVSLEEAVPTADLLAAQGVLTGAPGTDFVHPLVRETVYESIPPAERGRLHARAAELLVADGQPAERCALHVLAGPPAGEGQSVEVLREAARRVAARGDAGAAVAYLERALAEPPPPEDRTAVVHELGLAEYGAGMMEAAARHLAAAHHGEADPRRRAEAGRALALALFQPGRCAEAVAVIDGVLAGTPDLDPVAAAWLEAERHQAALMDPSLYRAAGDRVYRLAGETGAEKPGEAALLAALATEAALRTDGAEQVAQWCVTALDHGLAGDAWTAGSGVWVNAAFPLVFADRYSDAARVCANALDDARRRGSPVGAARARTIRALLHLRAGAVRDAAGDATVACELGLVAGFRVSVIAVGVLVEALVERDELDEADAALDAAGRSGPVPEQFPDNWVLHARGVLRLAQGRVDDAVADLEELGRRGTTGWRPWNPGILPYRSTLAMARLRAGDTAGARHLAGEELELARRWTDRTAGTAMRTLGLATGGARGLELLRSSARILEGSGAYLEHARSLAALGAAIRRRGGRTESREPLRTALAAAHRCGATRLAAEVRAELVASGARPRRSARHGVDALTPSELRVARMAADGMPNREIAQALFVTLRTVEVHLTHAYQKLAITSRDELPRALAG